MALITCAECGKSVSDTAYSCPSCGAPAAVARRNHPMSTLTKVFLGVLALGGVSAVLQVSGEPAPSLGGSDAGPEARANLEPAFGVVRYARKNLSVYGKPGVNSSVRSEVAAGTALRAASSDTSGWVALLRSATGDTIGFVRAAGLRFDKPAPLEIETSNWYDDSDFAGRGAVIWTAVVRNNTDRYVERALLEFTSYDAEGNVIDTDRSYASGLAPGGTASVKGYATYFGREKTGSIRIVR